jgi:hypothetical protein
MSRFGIYEFCDAQSINGDPLEVLRAGKAHCDVRSARLVY